MPFFAPSFVSLSKTPWNILARPVNIVTLMCRNLLINVMSRLLPLATPVTISVNIIAFVRTMIACRTLVNRKKLCRKKAGTNTSNVGIN